MELLLIALALAGIYYLGRRWRKHSIWFEGASLRPDDLYAHARELGRCHKAERNQFGSRVLLRRLQENFRLITRVYTAAAEDLRNKRQMVPAAEWLLDNYYIIEEQVKAIQLAVKKTNFYDLPVLCNGYLRGNPRIYAIVLEVISHTDGRLNEEAVVKFLQAYQEEAPLGIGEIWLLSLMVRIALIEKIHHLCTSLEITRCQWRQAERFLSRVKPEKLKEKLFALGRLHPAFAEHLLQESRQGLMGKELRDLLAEKLQEQDTTLEKLVHSEHQINAAQATSLGNAITSLKGASLLDWNTVFERLSFVDEILRADNVYREMDLASRNYYRRQVQVLARKLRISEIRVAKLAVELAQRGEGECRRHCGYYLLDQGKRELYARAGAKYNKISLSIGGYILLVMACSVAVAAAAGAAALPLGGAWPAVLGLLFFFPGSEVIVTFFNRVLARLKKPAFLPKLEYCQGIPPEKAAMVVIPALLPDAERTRELIVQLEVHWLANPDENLYFALLGDFKDSSRQEAEGDNEILRAALSGIQGLNKKYPGNRFFALVRKRQYSETQGKWMGWERKRGALVELNRLLLGSEDTSFISPPGNLPSVRYVLTLDADTRLPIDMAKKLVGTISHPLNEAELSEQGRPVRGYGLIQPRIGVSAESASKTWFAMVMAGPGGTDTYTHAISDVYQDWFGQGIFTGKGIYNLAAADKLLSALPENSILSHDLLEGGLLRTGLATDLELVDEFPGRYSSYTARGHRWTRGDWQLLPWLGPRVQGRKNPLTAITRWQIFDNLRRSLVPPGLFFFIAVSLLAQGDNWIWPALFLGGVVLPEVWSLVDFNWRGYLRSKAAGIKTPASRPRTLHRLGWQLAFLPYQAWVNIDAILRTVYRVFISRRNLLEWITAAEAEKLAEDDYRKQFGPALLAAAAVALLLLFVSPSGLLVYLPLLALWLSAPAIARRISRGHEEESVVEEEDRALLRKLARETWQYYVDLVGEETSYLPPDNYQVDPPTGIDYRTSPTNIGFYMLSALAARDFGFITTSEMIDRLEKTLKTVAKLEKWKGHLYNWYAVRDAELLRPRFVSTVDSGNFVGMLVALSQGLREYLARPVFDAASAQEVRGMLGGGAPAFKNNLDSWQEILAFPAKDGRVVQQLKRYRDELYTLFPHTEILVHPPGFLRENPAFWRLAQLAAVVRENPSPENLARSYGEILGEIEFLLTENSDWCRDYLMVWKDDLLRVSVAAGELVRKFHRVIAGIDALIEGADFSALYNPRRNLFSIGYSVDDEKLVDSYYDLLASEARLASYVAVVRRHVPAKHWGKKGRALVRAKGAPALVSWSGTMFEYLMPLLLMKNYPNTLLAETTAAVISAQQRYGKLRKVPWGVSESGYYAFDYRLNYQYRAFGIPDLGLKRGLVDDIVVSPYSTLLALPFAPKAAIANIRRLLSEGMGGDFGLYEAIDYTPERMPPKKEKALVQSYFAHHQGMSLISLVNYLHDFVMVRRFHKDPYMRAGELLLQETPPLLPIFTKQIREPVLQLEGRALEEKEVVRSFGLPQGSPPNCHLLSNGSYSVLLTDSGSGYSSNENIRVSRWRENMGNKYGTFIFIRSLNTDQVWSATMAPFSDEPDFYRVRFFQDHASYFREMANIDTKTDIIVSTEDNAEVRRVTLTNHGLKAASLEVTSFFELALAHHNSDLAHPAFNNLFVQTEPVLEHNCLLACRRPRSDRDPRLYALHQVVVEGESVGPLQYETDRGKFIGRGRDISCPAALHQPLSNTSGQVLDPAMSLRRQLKLGPGQSAVITFITAQGSSRREMLELAAKYNDTAALQRAFDMAATRSQVERRFLNLSPQLLAASQQAIGHLVFLSPTRRKYQEMLAKNTLGQQALWAQGISGDNPIVLVCVEDTDDVSIVEEAILAHEYWRFKGLMVDLVILHRGQGGYLEPVRELVRDMVQFIRIADILDKPGGIYIRSANQLTEAERYLFHGAARLILRPGSLAEQLEAAPLNLPEKQEFFGQDQHSPPGAPQEELLYYNGFGGFTPDGREYVIQLHQRMTPAPWSNILANPNFGCIVTERGGGYVFAENARENKLTPWSNDPVADPPGEVIYLRDEDSGKVWTVCAGPIWGEEQYTVRHGRGYTKFSHHSHGLGQELTVFVPRQDSVKVSMLKIRNDSPLRRRLTATYYVRPVLGASEEVSHLHLISNWVEDMLTFRNPYNSDFPGRIAWISASVPVIGYTGDSLEFLGPEGNMARPAALKRTGLSNTAGAGFNPCGAIQVALSIEPGEQEEVVFQLGQETDSARAKAVSEKYRQDAAAALEETRDFWHSLTSTIVARTPDSSLDILLPWLLYQTIACRMWARTGFYQCGGAYGFRDQLQDAANMTLVVPDLVRKQILIHAAHQFIEGDVQHWWHPGTRNRGVRTRFSDDLLWLPWTVAEYIEKTGDQSILAEEVPFLKAKVLEPGVDEYYGEAGVAEEKGSVYEHCLRAIRRALRFGSHGIPLIGSGDWNDGMSNVGRLGKGESIWLGWFLYDILKRFAPLCRHSGDPQLAQEYLEQAERIRQALEKNGWDGRWYRRAYFDDGTPLGAAENPECSIDSIAQSWAVISGGGRRDRVEEAMGEVETHLVREDEGLILLFTPPFDKSDLKPGYIKGYLPGVRENGGQYTHASAWAIQAMALLGHGDKALEWFQHINPILHSRTPIECSRYKTEPYVVAADVYSAPPHVGRGGWTWYTGAAGWLFRVCCENILGLKRMGNVLTVEPCIPGKWQEYSLEYRFGESLYVIRVLNPQGVNRGVKKIETRGVVSRDIELVDDGQVHEITVVMG